MELEPKSVTDLRIIFEGLWSDQIAQTFISVIIGWFLFAILMMRSKLEQARKFCAIMPNSLTSLGILGIFTGILLGFSQFHLNQIEKSVPALLDGMKLAFTTSFAGIWTSLAFKSFSAFVYRVRYTGEQVTPNNILSDLEI